jgi:hypothetical protein
MLFTFVYTGKRHLVRSTKAYTLPTHIAAHVDLVTGLTDFPPMSALRRLETRCCRRQ